MNMDDLLLVLHTSLLSIHYIVQQYLTWGKCLLLAHIRCKSNGNQIKIIGTKKAATAAIRPHGEKKWRWRCGAASSVLLPQVTAAQNLIHRGHCSEELEKYKYKWKDRNTIRQKRKVQKGKNRPKIPWFFHPSSRCSPIPHPWKPLQWRIRNTKVYTFKMQNAKYIIQK